MFEVDEESPSGAEEFVLPESVRCSIAVVDIEKEVRQGLLNQPFPSDCPSDPLFVPDGLRKKMLDFYSVVLSSWCFQNYQLCWGSVVVAFSLYRCTD